MSYNTTIINELAVSIADLERRINELDRIESANNYCYISSKEFVVAETSNTIDFIDIPDYFDDLIIILDGHTNDTTTTGIAVRMKFNDSTGAKYCYNFHGISTSSINTGTAVFGATYAQCLSIAAKDAINNTICPSKIHIYDYTSTLSNKNFMSRSYRHNSSTSIGYYDYVGSWYPTTPVAINKITLQCGATYYFDYPTKAILYGVKL